MRKYLENKSNAVKAICLYFSLSFIIVCPIAAAYTNEFDTLFGDLIHIYTMPCPLVTDYFELGSLPSAFLNAGICGMIFNLFMYISGMKADSSTFAGYFLVIAHCFYGLNLVNMLPPILGFIVYCTVKKQNFIDNFTTAMFSTAFGPFISELLFRYTLGDSFSHDKIQVTLLGVILTLVLCIALGFIIPAILPSAKKFHKGYDLYNAGLAFGIMGFFLNALMYNTVGVEPAQPVTHINEAYASASFSFTSFISLYLIICFVTLFILGVWLNRGKLHYKELLSESGYNTDNLNKYPTGTIIINLSFYGVMMLVYMVLVTELTAGAGYTGATLGVTFAALTFCTSAQHPKNVWPILAGYIILSIIISGAHYLSGNDFPWTLSTQCYINGVAFATGLCPISGKFGIKAGILAGITAAIISSSTSVLHGGFVLYNGGFTAGLAAMILIPLLEFYSKKKSSC